MRSAYPCLYILASLLACGPGGNSTTDTGNETTQSTATTSTADTTAEPTTSPTVASTGTTSLSSTSEPGTTGTTGTTSTTSTTSTTGTTGTTSTTDDTGSAVSECNSDADCKLQDDCCVCAGIPDDQNPVSCDLACDQSKCSELGIAKAVCRLGICETERLSCDQTKVVCDSLPPVCPEGQLPTTSPGCWTGKCVPAEFCDVVPDCGACPDGHLCVQNIDLAPNQPTCEPIPPGCGPDPDCACAGDLVCNDPFTLCVEQAGPVIHCECINC
jgi:hypothetical protein